MLHNEGRQESSRRGWQFVAPVSQSTVCIIWCRLVSRFTLLLQGSSREEMYVRLPSDSASQRTPLPLAKFFPLPGDFGTFTLENVRSPGVQNILHNIQFSWVLRRIFDWSRDLFLILGIKQAVNFSHIAVSGRSDFQYSVFVSSSTKRNLVTQKEIYNIYPTK